MKKLAALLVFLLSATPAFAGPPDDRVERIKASLRFKPVFAQTISKLGIADFLGVSSATAGCAPSGQARAFYDPVLNVFKVVDSSCNVIISGGGGGSTTVQWNQLLNPNANSSPNFGGAVFTFSNGTWDWGNFTVNLPHGTAFTVSSDGQIGYDTSAGNLLFYGGGSSILGRFDSTAALTDQSVVGISLTGGGQVKLVPLASNSSTGTSVLQVNNTNTVLGDVSCVTALGPPLTWSNCTPGVPINLQTTDYTIDPIPDRGTAIVTNDASNSTITFSQAISESTDTDANWFDFHFDKGTGAVNFALTAPSIFDSTGTQSETILTGEQCSMLTDSVNGIAYPKCHEPRIVAGGGISLSRSPYFLQISANPAAPANNGLITGGGVSWTSGLTFEVGAATYSIAGATYSTTETPVTLGAADPSNPRIDVIAVNTSSAVVVIPGTAAPNPSAPSIDPTSQLSLTFVTVPASSSTPVVSQTVIYRNNAGSPTEYNCTSTANLNCNSTTNPFGGTTHSLEATTAVAGNSATLTVGSGTVNLAQFQTLVFFIRNKATWAAAKNLQIFWRNGSSNVGTAVTFKNGVYGFDQTNTTTYQQIAIPVTAFQTGVASVTNLRFQVNGGGGSIGFYLGNILLQTGFVGGGGSGGGGSFTLQVNGTAGASTQSLDDSASVTFAQTTTGGVTHIQATAINSGVTSLTGDGTLFNNSGSTGAVILTPSSIAPNQVFAGPTSSATSNCVQGCTTTLENHSNSATVITKAYPTSVGTGHLLIASVACFDVFCATNAVTSTNNGTWSKAVSITHGAQVSIYYICNSVGGSETVTLTSSGSAFDMLLQIFEFSGNATVSCLDVNGTAVPNGGTTFSATTSGSVAQATELLFGAVSGNLSGPISGTGGWTTYANANTTNYDLASMINDTSSGLSGTQTVTASTTVAPTFWAGAIVTFKLNTTGSSPGSIRSLVVADLPTIPEVHYIPAANCIAGAAGSGWSYAVSTWTAACRAGSNNLGGALQLAPNTGGAAQFRVELPQDWDTTKQPYIRIEYASGANTSGTVIWTVASACTKADGSASDDPSFNAEGAFSSQTMAVANRTWAQTGQFTAITNGNGCIAGSGIIVKMTLSGTASSAINAYQAVLTIPRKPVVQAE